MELKQNGFYLARRQQPPGLFFARGQEEHTHMTTEVPESGNHQANDQAPRTADHEHALSKTTAHYVQTTLVSNAAKVVADILFKSIIPAPFGTLLTGHWGYPKNNQTLEEQKTALVKELVEAGIEPQVFDALLSSEMDRRLKMRFGIAFLALTVLFTAASYAIVVLNAIHKWNISDVAITALIIETPIQFIGLLYVIARNLFPDNHHKEKTKASPRRRPS